MQRRPVGGMTARVPIAITSPLLRSRKPDQALHSAPPRWPCGKASASIAAHLDSISAFAVDLFPGRIVAETQSSLTQWLPQWLLCQAPGVIGSALRLVGLVCQYTVTGRNRKLDLQFLSQSGNTCTCLCVYPLRSPVLSCDQENPTAHSIRHRLVGLVVVVVGWLLNVPATCECISGTDLHRQFLRAATLRWKLQIQLSISPSHSILTPGRPVPALTL